MGRRPPRAAWAAAAFVAVAVAGCAVMVADAGPTPTGSPAASLYRAPAFAVVDDASGRAGNAAASVSDAQSSLRVARQLETAFGLTMTSGYRDPAHNAAVGGVEGSYHTRGTPTNPGAVDLVGPIRDMRRALTWAREHVPALAEAMIHEVCTADANRPWQVVGGGLHLHLAFAAIGGSDGADAGVTATASRRRAGVADAPDVTRGCSTATERFGFAMEAIALRQADGDWSERRAAKATMTATARALARTYGPLTAEDRDTVIAARRRAQATLAQTEPADATTPDPHAAYVRYRTAMDRIDTREQAGAITATEADMDRSTQIDAALADTYGTLSAGDRRRVLADREAVERTPTPTTTTTTTTAPSPPATTTAPATVIPTPPDAATSAPTSTVPAASAAPAAP